MAHDVFISYSNKDKPIADGITANLEAAGLRCWIAPRDIGPGEDWPTAITKGIAASRVMVLVFSHNANMSDEVGRELYLAANSKLIIIPFMIENVKPEAGKAYYMGRTHWLDAMNPPTQEQIGQLIERVTSLLKPISGGNKAEPVLSQERTNDFREPLHSKRRWIIPITALVVVAALVITGISFLPKLRGAAQPEPTQGNPLTASPLRASQPTLSFVYLDREDFNDPQFDGSLPPNEHLKDSCSNMKVVQEKGSLTFQAPAHIRPDCYLGMGPLYFLSDITAVEFSIKSSSETPLNHPSFAFMLGTWGDNNDPKNLTLICGLNYNHSGCYVRKDQLAQEIYHTKMFPEKIGESYTFRIEILDPEKMTFRFLANGQAIGEFTLLSDDVAAYKDLAYSVGGGVNDMNNSTITAGTYFVDYIAIEQR
jgi:hypothetical protein